MAIKGNSGQMQLGLESVYGTAPAAMTRQIKVFNESLKYSPTRKDEGVLTGGKLTGKVATMTKKVEGGFSALARPDDIGEILKAAFGVEDSTPNKVSGSTAVYEHEFTLLGTDIADNLPSITTMVDRVVADFGYLGLKINSLSFSCQSGDYLKVDVTYMGKEQVAGTMTTGLSYSALIPFKFSNVTLKVDGVELTGTSVKFDLNNNLDSIQTSKSGLFVREPNPGAREIKIDIDTFYDSDSDDIINAINSSDEAVAVEINFVSEEEAETGYNYGLKFVVPLAQIEPVTPNLASADDIKMTISCKAVDAVDPVKCVLTNLKATAY